MTEPLMVQKSLSRGGGSRPALLVVCVRQESLPSPSVTVVTRQRDFEPVEYQARQSGTVYFCGCKRTGNRPLCDGTHATL